MPDMVPPNLVPWLDSSTPPTAEQAAELFAQGFRGWGGYVSGATPTIWSPFAIRIVLDAGFAFLPICAADLELRLSPFDLAADANRLVNSVPVQGVLCLDTEQCESELPGLDDYVNSFAFEAARLRDRTAIYSGAGYSGLAHNWSPAWSAPAGQLGLPPTNVPSSGAVQWAGNVMSDAGILVDLNLAGPGFPFTNRAGLVLAREL